MQGVRVAARAAQYLRCGYMTFGVFPKSPSLSLPLSLSLSLGRLLREKNANCACISNPRNTRASNGREWKVDPGPGKAGAAAVHDDHTDDSSGLADVHKRQHGKETTMVEAQRKFER